MPPFFPAARRRRRHPRKQARTATVAAAEVSVVSDRAAPTLPLELWVTIAEWLLVASGYETDRYRDHTRPPWWGLWRVNRALYTALPHVYTAPAHANMSGQAVDNRWLYTWWQHGDPMRVAPLLWETAELHAGARTPSRVLPVDGLPEHFRYAVNASDELRATMARVERECQPPLPDNLTSLEYPVVADTALWRRRMDCAFDMSHWEHVAMRLDGVVAGGAAVHAIAPGRCRHPDTMCWEEHDVDVFLPLPMDAQRTRIITDPVELVRRVLDALEHHLFGAELVCPRAVYEWHAAQPIRVSPGERDVDEHIGPHPMVRGLYHTNDDHPAALEPMPVRLVVDTPVCVSHSGHVVRLQWVYTEALWSSWVMMRPEVRVRDLRFDFGCLEVFYPIRQGRVYLRDSALWALRTGVTPTVHGYTADIVDPECGLVDVRHTKYQRRGWHMLYRTDKDAGPLCLPPDLRMENSRWMSWLCDCRKEHQCRDDWRDAHFCRRSMTPWCLCSARRLCIQLHQECLLPEVRETPEKRAGIRVKLRRELECMKKRVPWMF